MDSHESQGEKLSPLKLRNWDKNHFENMCKISLMLGKKLENNPPELNTVLWNLFSFYSEIRKTFQIIKIF